MTKEQTYIDFIISEIEKGTIRYTDIFEVFLSKFKVSEPTFAKYYKLANEAYLNRQQAINELKTKETIKNEIEAHKTQVKTKLQIIEDLENEIISIEKTIKDGFLIKQINVNGEVLNHKEIFGSREIEIWHRMLKDKRELLIKLQGFEAPKKQETTLTNGVTIELFGEKKL